jgi:hypothetical protein
MLVIREKKKKKNMYIAIPPQMKTAINTRINKQIVTVDWISRMRGEITDPSKYWFPKNLN